MLTRFFLIVLLGCALDAAFIVCEFKKKFLPAVVLKGLASCVFVLLGFLCFANSVDTHFGSLVIAGLICGAIGDVLLNLRLLLKESAAQKIFLLGIAVFMAGHILYVIALIGRDPGALYIALPLCAVLSAVALTLILKNVDADKKFKIFGGVYIAVVLLMMSTAISLLIRHPENISSTVFTVGAVLFAASDIILIFHLFGRKKIKVFRAINLSAYYIGQLLIAASLLLI